MRTARDETTARVVGAEVGRLRKARGWSLRKLGQQAGRDHSFLRRIENGESATTDTYVALATALGVSLSALFAVVRPVGINVPPARAELHAGASVTAPRRARPSALHHKRLPKSRQ